MGLYGINRIIWDYMGFIGFIMGLYGIYRIIWDYMGFIGFILWDYMGFIGLYGIIWDLTMKKL